MLIETRDLTKTFDEVRAVDGLSLAIPEGPVGLVGPNGAGKTTFLRLLLGLLKPTAGTATVLGHPLTASLAVRERVGYMPEHDCLLPDMTGVGFVAYMGRVSGLDRNTALSRAHDVLQFVGVEEERYRKIAEYSTGMKQKVKLAQAMVHDPDLYIFDEPTTGLDPRGREEMLRLLQAIGETEGKSILLSSHLLPDVETTCRHVAILDGGRLVASGDLAALLGGSGEWLRVRVRGDAAAFGLRLREAGVEVHDDGAEMRVPRRPGVEGEVFRAAAAAGVEVRYLGAAFRDLEELFLDLVDRPGRGV
jgi:ABC-2 type transport system ATP-binding protein